MSKAQRRNLPRVLSGTAKRGSHAPTRLISFVMGLEISLPRPTPLYLEYERPTQERTHQYQSGEQAKTCESKLDRNGLDYIGGDEEFEAKQ